MSYLILYVIEQTIENNPNTKKSKTKKKKLNKLVYPIAFQNSRKELDLVSQLVVT